ncbi:peroxiredoxin-like family protein [Aquimarina brevivitae]|uniref:Peroxiredoxin n=1 Tax=Aquimarina brevivitae TaxID=323412 RepID=A0A4Q7NTZ7_9FLAO|nr:peroxiredoxin-like family protein [Aquimarina brevivitae]RZS90585.1 peroxiredoxin [Aquimarina brevivitae]
MLKPRKKVPNLTLDLINDTHWKLLDQTPDKYTLLIFYRGLHCPICKSYLEDLKSKLDEFIDRGINVIAISGDSEERAKKTGEKWNIDAIPVGYNLSMDTAKEWGLYISAGISDKEPDEFSEPGLFLVEPDGKLYFSAVQTMPFARPNFEDVLKAVDFIEKEDYPARGEQ